MRFIRIGDETIRLDLITHVKEGCTQETYYGRSVRKTTDDRYGWLEVHFVSGEVLKIEGEASDVLRRILDAETKVRDLGAGATAAAAGSAAATPARRPAPREGGTPEPVGPPPRQEHATRPAEEHRSSIRNGFGR
jgi:hypothetical protein